jgi:peptidyl-prolyl cis-trans isomerase SurA
MRFPYSLSIRPRRLLASLSMLAIVCGAAGCNNKPKAAAVSPDTWATVDGRSIVRDDIEKTFRRTQDQAATLSSEEAMTVKLSILNEMIVQDILLARAVALKIDVTAAELDAAFAERKKNLTDAQFDEEMKKRSLSAADMRESVRRELLAKKLLDQEVVAKINVTEQEVNDFFAAHKAQFTVAEESYRIAQIVISPERAAQQVNRTGNDATTPQEAVFKVRMVMERLQAGARFSEVAMDYSEDPESVQRGGDLGLVPMSALKQAPEPLRNAVIGQKPGTAKVVSAGGIYTIVMVVAHEPAGERGLTTPGVKDGITQTLKDRKEQLLRTAYLSAARGDATVVNHAARRVVESQGKVQ